MSAIIKSVNIFIKVTSLACTAFEPGLDVQTLHILEMDAYKNAPAWTKDNGPFLKVPKREIFVTELFILSDPIWVGDLRNEPKKLFV